MSSIIDRGLEVIGAGRQRIGISGIYKDKETIIDLDVITTYTLTENATVTSHPIEADKNADLKIVSDYVIPGMPFIGIEIVLSDNLGVKFNTTDFVKNNSVSMKDKVKILTFWQKTGSVLKLLGYKTGQGLVGKVLNYPDSGISNFFDSKADSAYYTGLDTDIVTDLVLGNIIWKRTTEIGTDISANITIQKIHRAIPKSDTITAKSNSGIQNKGKQEGQPNNKPVAANKASQLKGLKK